jgi:hypothetical protein
MALKGAVREGDFLGKEEGVKSRLLINKPQIEIRPPLRCAL